MTLAWTAIEASAGTLGRVERVLGRAASGLRAGTLADDSLARALGVAGEQLAGSVRVVDQVGDATAPVRQLADPLHTAGLRLIERAGFVRGGGTPEITTLAQQLDEAAEQARSAAGMLRQEAHYARTAQGGAAQAADGSFPIHVDDLRPPSAQVTARELAELEQRALARTPGSIADTVIYGKFGNKPVWLEYLRLMEQDLGAAKAAAARDDLQRAWEITVDVTERLKVLQPRERPFALSRLLADSPVAHHPSSLSFPSGHTAVSFASARIMGHHWPERADEFHTVANRVRDSRLDAGVHFRSDVEAGEIIGQRVADLVIAGP